MRPGAALLLVALVIAGCGGGSDLRVSAASSLRNALPQYRSDARYSFAGSDELAAQIRAGARPDVYAAANETLPRKLHADGLVERPVPFARNRLVLAVPVGGSRVGSLADLTRPGVTLALAAPAVPVGAYTRELLARLGPRRERAILANVRSNEPDVAGVVGKVSQRAVDAGFVYVTDVIATDGRLRAIELPARLRPSVTYAAAVVKGAPHATEAAAYIRGLAGGAGRRALRYAGFDPPPR